MRISWLVPLVNSVGAVSCYIYFFFILETRELSEHIPRYYSPMVFVIGTLILLLFGMLLFRKPLEGLFEVAYGQKNIKEYEAEEVYHLQREALKFPFVLSMVNLLVWIVAGFMFGLLEPAITNTIFDLPSYDLVYAIRRFLGISFLGGGITTMIMFFVVENEWRAYIPSFFPEGRLRRVKHIFRLNIRRRFLVVTLSIILTRLSVLGMTIYSKITVLRVADETTRIAILNSLMAEFTYIMVDSAFISLVLAYFLSKSISDPLFKIKTAIREVEKNNLDTRVEVLANDEIGEVAQGFNSMISHMQENQFIKDSFGKYVSREIRDEIIAGNASLDGEMKRVTLLFSDLRNFTPLVEQHHPKKVVTLMNQYFTEMTQTVNDHRGLVVQYVGDAIEAVFGAPIGYEDHPDMAVQTALEMRTRLLELNERFKNQGFEPLAHGIGIHSGAVLAGSIGSEERMSYALVGDAVNSASRIEGLTKTYSCDIIISQTTVNLLAGSYQTRQLEPVKVKGKEEELIIYSLL